MYGDGHRLESSIIEIGGFGRKAMVAMGSLEQRPPERAEIPKFDGGMVNIRALIRITAESLVNEIMSARPSSASSLEKAAPRRSRMPSAMGERPLQLEAETSERGGLPRERQPLRLSGGGCVPPSR